MKGRELTAPAIPSLSGNALKVLAAATMLADHVGLVLLPGIPALRFIGRLAFPIFAFMIAEGCAHSRNRLRYFLQVLLLATVCQVAYTVAMGSWFFCVPVSFSIAIALVLALEKWKNALFAGRLWQKLLWGAVFLGGVAAVWLINRLLMLDYGFWGCMMPVAASLLRKTNHIPKKLARLDHNLIHVLAMGVCMIPLAVQLGPWQWWSLLALPLLSCYNGRRGKYRLKYFFYIFYPAHLLAVQGLAMLLQFLEGR